MKAKGTIFAVVYRRIVPRLGHAQAIGAITHRLCRLIWKILHERVRYEERGPAVSAEAKRVRARRMIRELRSLGYRPGSSARPRKGGAIWGIGRRAVPQPTRTFAKASHVSVNATHVRDTAVTNSSPPPKTVAA